MKTPLPLLTFLLLIVASVGAKADTSDAEALAFLQKHTPVIHAKITKLIATDPADYRNALDEAQKAAADYAGLESAGDAKAAAAYLKMYQIDFEAITTADLIVLSKEDDDKQRLTKSLRQLIAASLEQWAVVEQARIRRLEKELAALKDKVQEALRNPDKLIDSDMAKLIEECRNYRSQKQSKKGG